MLDDEYDIYDDRVALLEPSFDVDGMIYFEQDIESNFKDGN